MPTDPMELDRDRPAYFELSNDLADLIQRKELDIPRCNDGTFGPLSENELMEHVTC